MTDLVVIAPIELRDNRVQTIGFPGSRPRVPYEHSVSNTSTWKIASLTSIRYSRFEDERSARRRRSQCAGTTEAPTCYYLARKVTTPSRTHISAEKPSPGLIIGPTSRRLHGHEHRTELFHLVHAERLIQCTLSLCSLLKQVGSVGGGRNLSTPSTDLAIRTSPSTCVVYSRCSEYRSFGEVIPERLQK